MRRILLPEEWGTVYDIVTEDFRNAMPDRPDQATFLAETDGERLRGFVHIESLLHFNCVWVAEEERGTDLAVDLMRDAASRIPKGFSAVWLTDRSVGAIARRLGAREVGTYRVYRKDV